MAFTRYFDEAFFGEAFDMGGGNPLWVPPTHEVP